MFTYEFPKWNVKLNTKLVSIVATMIYIVTTVPLLVVGFFNWPSADDMSLALETYRCFKSTGNVFATFFTAFKVGFNEYMTWMGYFFSNVMFCYSPSIFGERWYALTSVWMIGILTFGVCYFYNALFVRALKGDRHLTNAAAMLTLTVIVQCMPEGLSRVEAFYWYSGAINYMFMLGMGLFWMGLMIRILYEEGVGNCNKDQGKKLFRGLKSGSRSRKVFWACFWGFWLGGANYMTALQCAICSALIIIIVILRRCGLVHIDEEGCEKVEKSQVLSDECHGPNVKLVWLPGAVNLVGFMASCLAPGNATREALVEGFGPIKAIFVAILYEYVFLINQYTRWEVLAAAAIMIVISWKLADGIKHRFEHPFIFVVFAFGLSASNMVPPLYALASMEAGRLKSIVFAEYIVMMMLTVFYVTSWAKQRLCGGSENAESAEVGRITAGRKDAYEERFLSPELSRMIFVAIAFILFGSALCVYENPQYYSASSAIVDVASGDAAVYLRENQERLAILQDHNVTDAVLMPYSKKPQMLVFDDITGDKEYWINRVMARYYEKESVVLGGEQ